MNHTACHIPHDSTLQHTVSTIQLHSAVRNATSTSVQRQRHGHLDEHHSLQSHSNATRRHVAACPWNALIWYVSSTIWSNSQVRQFILIHFHSIALYHTREMSPAPSTYSGKLTFLIAPLLLLLLPIPFLSPSLKPGTLLHILTPYIPLLFDEGHHSEHLPSTPIPNLPRTPRSCKNTTTFLFDSTNRPCLPLTYLSKRHSILHVQTPSTHYLYCAVAKTGTTYHQAVMQRLLGASRYQTSPFIHSPRSRYRLYLPAATTATTPDLSNLLTNPDIPKYVVIRNPLTRLLSAFRDKVEHPRGPSFSQWVHSEFPLDGPNLSARVWRGRNVHWRPQTEHCGGAGLRDLPRFFRQFRFEQPETIVDYLETFIPSAIMNSGWGMERNLSFRAFMTGPRRRSGEVEKVFFNYFRSLRVFDRVVTLYQRDVRDLGYEQDVAELRRRLVEIVHGRNRSVADAWTRGRGWASS